MDTDALFHTAGQPACQVSVQILQQKIISFFSPWENALGDNSPKTSPNANQIRKYMGSQAARTPVEESVCIRLLTRQSDGGSVSGYEFVSFDDQRIVFHVSADILSGGTSVSSGGSGAGSGNS